MLQKPLTKSDIDQFYVDLESIGLLKPVAELARISGLSTGNVSEYLSKKKKPSRKLIDAFYLHYKNSINIPHETMVMEQSPTYLQTRAQIKNGGKSGIPVFTGNTRAGTIEVYSDDPSVNEPVDHLPATMFPGCNHAERVSGDSMHPVLINQGYAIGKIIDKKGSTISISNKLFYSLLC